MRPVNRPFPDFDPRFAHETISYDIVQTGLIDTIGHYCSICETPILIDGLFLEHIFTNVKLLRQIRKEYWQGLLLVCFECQTQKLNRPITEENWSGYAWPFDMTYRFSFDHKDYPFCVSPFMYVLRKVTIQGTSISGDMVIVESNNTLDGDAKNKAQNIIDLYQLNTRHYDSNTHTLKQTPDHICQQDMRLFNRTDVWIQAIRLLQDPDIQRACMQYKNDSNVIEPALRFVPNMATRTGFWSVWMAVFWQAFKNPYLLHELFVETIRRPGDIVSGYQALLPDTPHTSGHRPARSESNVKYRHFPGTAIDRISYPR